MSDLAELQKRALEIRRRYDDLNRKDGQAQWGPKDYAMGFVGDVGDLMKIVMAKENMRRMDSVDVKLKHELADCLWSLLVLASHYGTGLEDEFCRTMDELDVRINKAMT
ncbi:MAG TPA: hypothetical protein VGG13_01840 [Candidatus Saccharimonadales bacterium]|jgi:NTP pyrophosphatase (non-canonical NTP hydrolase)